MSYKGKKNIYTCEKCGFKFVTIDRDEGTTPFITMCQLPGPCGGMTQSSFYQVDQSLTPTFEWYRMTDTEAAEKPASWMQHHLLGGLFLREIK